MLEAYRQHAAAREAQGIPASSSHSRTNIATV